MSKVPNPNPNPNPKTYLQFNLNVKGATAGDSRRGTSSQTVEVSSQPVLKMSTAGSEMKADVYNTEGGTHVVGYEEFQYQLKVNPEDSLNLDSAITSGGTNNAAIKTVWSEEKQNLDLSTFAGREMNTKNSSLVLQAGSLIPGGTYTFTAKGEEMTATGKVEGYTSINVMVNTPPSGGACTVEPSTGYTQTTNFKVSCSGFSDDSGKDLTYSFGKFDTKEGVESFTPLVTKGEDNFFEMKLGEAGTVTVGAEVFDDMDSSAEFKVTLTATDFTQDPTLVGGTDAEKLAAVAASNTGDAIARGDTAGALNALVAAGDASNTLTTGGGRRSGSVDAVATSVKIGLLNTLNTIVSAGPSISTPDNIQLQMTPLSTIVKGSTGFNDTEIGNAASIIKKLSDSVTGQGLGTNLATSFVRTAGDILQGLSTGRNEAEVKTARSKVETAFITAGKGVLKSKVPGEAVTDISAGSDNRVLARRVSRTSLVTESIATTTNSSDFVGYNSFSLPAGLLSLLPQETGNDNNDAIDYIHTATDKVVGGDDYTFKSSVHGLTLSSAASLAPLPITLTGNDRITLNMATTPGMGGDSHCMFYDTMLGAFSREGVTEASNSPGSALGMVTCETTHLTDFAVAASWVVTASMNLCPSNHSFYSSPEARLISTTPLHNARSVKRNETISLHFKEPMQIGAGSITLLPKEGIPVVIPVKDSSQVSLDTNLSTLIINPTGDLPGGEFSVSYPQGLVQSIMTAQNSSKCCTRKFPDHHLNGVSNYLFVGQSEVPKDFIIEFDLTLKANADFPIHIFTFGNGDKMGPSVWQAPYTKTIQVLVDTENQPANGVSSAGNMELHQIAHFEISMTGNVLTIKQDGINSKCVDLGSPKADMGLEPLFLGTTNSSAYYSIGNLTLHGVPLKITTEDSTVPEVIYTYPNANTTMVSQDTEMLMIFNTNVRQGIGSIEITSGTGITYIDISDTSQVTFSGANVTVNPSSDISMLDSQVTMGSGVITSIGAYTEILDKYSPVITTALGTCETGYNVGGCYHKCRMQVGCLAFKYAETGPYIGRCCLFSAFTYAEMSATQAFVSTPGETFNQLTPGELGVSYPGLMGPDAKIEGAIILSNIDVADMQSAAIQESMKESIAIVLNDPSLGYQSGTNNITKEQITLAVPSSGRRLLSVTVTYTIQLTAAQATSSAAAATALGTALSAANPAFVQTFVSEATAAGAMSAAVAQFLAAQGSMPTVIQGEAAFSFVVADTVGPTVSIYDPPIHGAEVHPAFNLKLTFNEPIQLGTGTIHLVSSGSGAIQRNINVNSDQVVVEGNTLTLYPKYWFADGVISVTVPAGVVKDLGIGASPNDFAGLGNPTVYTFTVQGPEKPKPQAFVHIGVADKPNACSYMMAHPWYTCHDFVECTLFVKPTGVNCGTGGTRGKVQFKKVTMAALQHIADKGFEKNGGDGRDTILNFNGGLIWPEGVVADIVTGK